MEGGNTLVVLPTGLGKTFIGIAVIADSLVKGKKSVFLAPTKPLVEQHYGTLSQSLKLTEGDILCLTGSLDRKRRKGLGEAAKVIVATPQTLVNELKKGDLSLDDFQSVIFDECHRAVGKYAYTYIADECAVRDILVVGLTASPGSKREKINALVDSLRIKNIELRVSQDNDVARYVMPKFMHLITVEKTARISHIADILKPLIESNLNSLRKMGLLRFNNFERIPKGVLLQAGDDINKIQAPNYKFAALFSYVKLLNLMHAYDLLLTEGIYPFHKYLESLANREKKSRAIESLLKSKEVGEARRAAEEAVKNGEEHAKVIALLDVIKDYKNSSIIVFVQYRLTIKMLVEFLVNNGFSARPFVGKKEGVTQEMQKQTILDFREKKFNVLVASSIAEEGLDIPSVDMVLFYEPIPNEIRNIQRRGRTGRFRSGEVYVLMAKGTKDEIYMQISRQKEEKMRYLINRANQKLHAKYMNGGDGEQRLLNK